LTAFCRKSLHLFRLIKGRKEQVEQAVRGDGRNLTIGA
jgi:hypothetical protein